MRSATLAGWFHHGGEADDSVADADASSATGHEGEERLGRAHVGVLVEGVVLHRPDDIEPQLLGEIDLLHDLAEDAVIGLPRHLGHLSFIDQRKAHFSPFGEPYDKPDDRRRHRWRLTSANS